MAREIPFYRSPSGLWIPHRATEAVATVPAASTDIPTLKFALVTVGYEMVYGGASTVDGIVDRLRHCALEQIVAHVGRISHKLQRYSGLEEHAEGQGRLALNIFGRKEAATIGQALRGADPTIDWNRRGVLFHERQTLNLLKVAFLALRPGDDPDDPADSLQPLGEALLMMNDIVDAGVSGLSASNSAQGRGLELYLFANTLFYQSRNELAEIARAHELFVQPNLEVEGADDLGKRLARATGSTPDFTWWALRALHAYYFAQDEETIDRGPVSLNRQTAFADNFDLTPEESERAFAVATLSAEDMKQQIEQTYSYRDLRPFDVLPFARHPLVAFGERVYYVSLPLLRDLAGMNLQHRFLDPNVFSREERDEFLQIRGRLFEDYLDRLLHRTFGDARYYGPEELATAPLTTSPATQPCTTVTRCFFLSSRLSSFLSPRASQSRLRTTKSECLEPSYGAPVRSMLPSDASRRGDTSTSGSTLRRSVATSRSRS